MGSIKVIGRWRVQRIENHEGGTLGNRAENWTAELNT